VLRVKRSRSIACSGAGGGGVLRAKRSGSTACSEAGGGDVLRAKRLRLRAKRSSSVEGALRRSRRAPGVGGVEDLKRTSGKILLNVERARCTTRVH
jgi:hypothetical protein